jgi:hypothetical protein
MSWASKWQTIIQGYFTNHAHLSLMALLVLIVVDQIAEIEAH